MCYYILKIFYIVSQTDFVTYERTGEGKEKMMNALGTKTKATGSFSTEIPSATDAGEYYVWFKAVGDAGRV